MGQAGNTCEEEGETSQVFCASKYFEVLLLYWKWALNKGRYKVNGLVYCIGFNITIQVCFCKFCKLFCSFLSFIFYWSLTCVLSFCYLLKNFVYDLLWMWDSIPQQMKTSFNTIHDNLRFIIHQICVAVGWSREDHEQNCPIYVFFLLLFCPAAFVCIVCFDWIFIWTMFAWISHMCKVHWLPPYMPVVKFMLCFSTF